MGGGARTGATASRPTGNRQFTGRGSNVTRNGSNWNHNGGDWRHGDRDDRWRHSNNYYFYNGGFGYPYYGYGFGYPFGYGGFGYPYYAGYGYGYPYYGGVGVSATFYNNGYASSSQGGYQTGNGSVVARVQQRLARAGYYHGAIDGVIGNGTRSAIRAYERAQGLQVDGRINSQLLGHMGVS
jgi:hypothetical protein